ncbi:aldehyde dehydrogenase family protein [Paracoccus sediminicola]|uniref:aldehyde dehydrogenase family protein n=1 Tax=Paracoccus sediminicola TaxID=3017783 RepID=UPI0022F080DA|nr:aldehyde dehydrogenase family protein [Paracoccus sediminicola]WBU56621.1 aldehyde dehydrogenase family protein [Paracoccus sediminicola]
MNAENPRDLPRVTYSNIREDFSGVHDHFDGVLPRVRETMLGQDQPNLIDGQDDRAGAEMTAQSPIDRRLTLGRFVAADADAVNRAFAAARRAQPEWAASGWAHRVAVLRKAADVLEDRKYEVSAACLFEVGKSRMEAIGEIEETVDIIRTYAGFMEEAQGFDVDLDRVNPGEETFDKMRPFGVFGVIAPFNFPVALSVGMTSAALLAGNAVVYKPSPDAALTGRLLAEIYRDAGVPAGVFNLVCGGEETGRAIAGHPDLDGIAFTGSHRVGMELLREVGAGGQHARPVLAEMGGKNPCYVTGSATLDDAVSGLVRSAYGLQGQKCSACSVAFLHDDIHDDAVARLRDAANAVKIGDPAERDVFMGPLINDTSLDRFLNAVQEAKAAGATVHGGERLSGGIYDHGCYVSPALVTGLPDDHWLHREELFAPFLTVRRFSDLAEAITRGNAVQFGLTAGIYTGDQSELDLFLNRAAAGALYANRPSGATTGAWPGTQTFCGWKGSGTGSKGGLGAWYLPQFMREQSHTIMRPAG